MKVGKQFNTLTYGEYLYLIDNHKKFTDFNTLGLFRSIVETSKLSLEEKLELRKVSVAAFAKTFNFLQLKDPTTYFKLSTLGETLTEGDENQVWENIKRNQQKIWEGKQLSHRNFGTYSKHLCGYPACPLNGMMIRQGSDLADGGTMRFYSDNRNRRTWPLKLKARQHKRDRKSEQQVTIQRFVEE